MNSLRRTSTLRTWTHGTQNQTFALSLSRTRKVCGSQTPSSPGGNALLADTDHGYHSLFRELSWQDLSAQSHSSALSNSGTLRQPVPRTTHSQPMPILMQRQSMHSRQRSSKPFPASQSGSRSSPRTKAPFRLWCGIRRFGCRKRLLRSLAKTPFGPSLLSIPEAVWLRRAVPIRPMINRRTCGLDLRHPSSTRLISKMSCRSGGMQQKWPDSHSFANLTARSHLKLSQSTH